MKKQLTELEKYQEGFNLLMDYFDSFDKEQKQEIDKELKQIGL